MILFFFPFLNSLDNFSNSTKELKLYYNVGSTNSINLLFITFSLSSNVSLNAILSYDS